MLTRLARVARSLVAGGAATLVDLGSLFLLVTVLGVSPRVANVPALLAGGTVMFLGQRHLAFRAADRGALGQAARFVCVHAVTLTLNAVLFDAAMRLAGAWPPYWIVRLVVGSAVFSTWSYPMFRRVFRVASCDARASSALAASVSAKSPRPS